MVFMEIEVLWEAGFKKWFDLVGSGLIEPDLPGAGGVVLLCEEKGAEIVKRGAGVFDFPMLLSANF